MCIFFGVSHSLGFTDCIPMVSINLVNFLYIANWTWRISQVGPPQQNTMEKFLTILEAGKCKRRVPA